LYEDVHIEPAFAEADTEDSSLASNSLVHDLDYLLWPDKPPAAAPPAAKPETSEWSAGAGVAGPLNNMDTIFPGLDDVIAVAHAELVDNSIRGHSSDPVPEPSAAKERTPVEPLPASVQVEAEHTRHKSSQVKKYC
jgi:hypothetical protein